MLLLMLDRSGGGIETGGLGASFDQVHGVEDGFDDGGVADGRIQHDVIEGAGRPVGIEVVLDEGDALAVHGVDGIFGVGFPHPLFPQAAEFLGTGRVEKDVEGVATFAEKEGSAASDKDGISLLGDPASDLFHHFDHVIGIENVAAGEG